MTNDRVKANYALRQVIRDLRESKGYTTRELEVHLKTYNVSGYENGHRLLTFCLLSKYAEFFNISLFDIFDKAKVYYERDLQTNAAK